MQQVMDATLERTVALMPDGAAARARIDGMVRAHFAMVWRTLRRLGLSDADADDAAQQVFLTTSRKLDRVNPESERAFLLGVAVRVAADARKARRRQPMHSDAAIEDTLDPAPDPEQALEQRRACQLLDSFMEQLDQKARAVFALYEIEGLNMREIASALAEPPGTIASRLRRARAQFHDAVARHRSDHK